MGCRDEGHVCACKRSKSPVELAIDQIKVLKEDELTEFMEKLEKEFPKTAQFLETVVVKGMLKMADRVIGR